MGSKCSFVRSGVDGIWKTLSNPISVLIVLRWIQRVGKINEHYGDSFEMPHEINNAWCSLLNIQICVKACCWCWRHTNPATLGHLLTGISEWAGEAQEKLCQYKWGAGDAQVEFSMEVKSTVQFLLYTKLFVYTYLCTHIWHLQSFGLQHLLR